MVEEKKKTENDSAAAANAANQKACPAPSALPPEPGGHLLFRRNFFSVAGSIGILTIISGISVGFVRFMFPRVLFEPSLSFKAGFPEEYAVGEVSAKWKKSHKVWIVREKEGFYALLAVCTHLGCTPGWFEVDSKFKCFCHGSGFRKSGINYEGPAPRSLERVKVTLADDGQLLIDKSVIFKAERNEWSAPGAFLKI